MSILTDTLVLLNLLSILFSDSKSSLEYSSLQMVVGDDGTPCGEIVLTVQVLPRQFVS